MPFTTIILDGGLDLQTAPINVTPGRLYACDNFEVNRHTGYSRVDGYERFDGGPSPSSSDCLAFVVVGGGSGLAGQYATVDGAVKDALIIGTARDGGDMIVYVRANSPVGELRGSELVARVAGGSGARSFPLLGGVRYPLDEGLLTAQAWQAMSDTAYMLVRQQIQPVPGVGPVHGLFWMRDALYAARDYVAVKVVGLANGLASEDSVAGAGFSGKVFAIEVNGETATVVLRSAIGAVPTSGAIKKAGVDVATIVGPAESPGAGLYKAVGSRGGTLDSGSWQHQEIGHSLRFSAIGDFTFPEMNRLKAGAPDPALTQATPWFVADQVASTGKNMPWTGAAKFVDALKASDGDTSYAYGGINVHHSGVAQSPYFCINKFGIDDAALPPGSILVGLELEITRTSFKLMAAKAFDEIVRIDYPGSPQRNVAKADAWSNAWESISYGGPGDLLGCNGLTAETVKRDDFGMSLQIRTDPKYDAGSVGQAQVTCVRLRVHYIPPQPSFYVWNPEAASPSAVRIGIVKSYPDPSAAGPGIGGSQGILYIAADGAHRAVMAGEQIRSMPQSGAAPDGGVADGSEVVATVASSMTRNLLDGSAKLAAAKSKYQHVTANFYASANFEAIHGVSGAGPAFLYDGYAFARILTGTPAEDETPRHIAAHQSSLFLGYPSGSVQHSAPGDPLNFDVVDGAGEIGVASPVTGLYPLNGQSLALFARDNVQMMQGDVGSPTMGFVSPNTGCIEYTAQDIGSFLYTSNRGVESMGQTPAYGDFANESLSAAVGPWLSRRVQRSVAFEGPDRSCINALMVRNKLQYRLFFADRKILTATFPRPGEPPQYTIQTHPVAWPVLMAATESTGRDRLFGAHADGYVYELDRGNRFDATPITASLTLAVDDQKAAYVNKDYTDAHVHGMAADWATFTMSRSVNYDTPDASVAFPQVFGSKAAKASGVPAYAVSFTEVRIVGRSISFRFDTTTATQSPMTLQAVSYNVITIGEKRT